MKYLMSVINNSLQPPRQPDRALQASTVQPLAPGAAGPDSEQPLEAQDTTGDRPHGGRGARPSRYAGQAGEEESTPAERHHPTRAPSESAPVVTGTRPGPEVNPAADSRSGTGTGAAGAEAGTAAPPQSAPWPSQQHSDQNAPSQTTPSSLEQSDAGITTDAGTDEVPIPPARPVPVRERTIPRYMLAASGKPPAKERPGAAALTPDVAAEPIADAGWAAAPLAPEGPAATSAPLTADAGPAIAHEGVKDASSPHRETAIPQAVRVEGRSRDECQPDPHWHPTEPAAPEIPQVRIGRINVTIEDQAAPRAQPRTAPIAPSAGNPFGLRGL